MPETNPAQQGPETPDWVKAMGMEGMYNTNQYNYEPAVTEKFVDGVKNLNKLQFIKTLPSAEQQKRLSRRDKDFNLDTEIVKQREYISELREELFVDQVNVVGGIQFEMMGFQSPFPYETKYGLNFLNNIEERTEKELTLKRGEKLSEESKLIFREMRETAIMTTSMYHILEGLGSAMKAYYDGELEANSLYSMYRRITGEDLSKVFNDKIAGASLNQIEKAKLAELGYLKKDEKTGEVETYKEKSTRLTSDAFYWDMALASAAQWDHINNTSSPRSMKLSEQELKFVQLVFGTDAKDEGGTRNPLDYDETKFIDYNGRKIPESIMTWFAMGGTSSTNRQTFESLVEILLNGKYREKIAQVSSAPDFDTQVRNLANTIKSEARVRLEKYDGEKDVDGKLLTAVFNQNIIMSNGFMLSGDFCWRYDNSLVDGVLKRKTEIGSIYNTFDIPTIYYWINHKILYDDRGEDRSTVMPASIGEFRRMFDDQPPYFKLDIRERAGKVKDDEMLKMLDWVTEKGKNPYEDTVIREDGGKFGKLNERFVNFFGKNVSAFLVPFTEKKDGDGKPVWLSLPVPIPGVTDSINFFRGLSKNIKDDPMTFFDRMINKEDVRSLDWKSIPYDSFDYWRVNTAQMHKWLVFLIGTHELDRDKFDAFKQLFAEAKAVNIKKLDKTGRLGTRTERQKKGVWNLAFAPFLIALASAKVTGILGRDYFEGPGLFDINSAKNKFKERIADWVNSSLDLPRDADELENFSGTMAFMIFFYGRIMLRISNAAKSNYGLNQITSRESIRKIIG